MRDVIASPDNKFYKLLKKLDKKKYRDENSIFKAEGEKFLNENINFNKIIVKESKFEYFDERYGISEHDNLTILKDNLFDEVSTQENSQGIMFLYSKNLNTIEDVKGDVVILDDVQDPGNIGTIIRTMIATKFVNLLNSFMKFNSTVPRGPLRFFSIMTSMVLFGSTSGTCPFSSGS